MLPHSSPVLLRFHNIMYAACIYWVFPATCYPANENGYGYFSVHDNSRDMTKVWLGSVLGLGLMLG